MGANRRASLVRRMTLVLLCMSVVAQHRHNDGCGAQGLALSGFVSSVHVASNTRLRTRAHHSRSAAPRRSSRTILRAELSEDDFSRLMRRMTRLERIVEDQNAEVEEMRSSMEQMRIIVQIQAQIDSCLVDKDGLLLSSSLAGDDGGEPDPRLVRQAIRLLRARHRVIQAWEFDGEQEETSSSPTPTPSPSPPHPPPRDPKNPIHNLENDNSCRRNRARHDDNNAALRRQRRTRRQTRDSRFPDFDEQDAQQFFGRSMYDDPLMTAEAVSGEGGRGSTSFSRRSSGTKTEAFEPRFEQQRPPKTNQDAADAAGAGVVAALMEGRRRLIVEVDDAQLRYNSQDFCHEAMAEFVELLTLPLTTALENLKARQNRCKIVIQGVGHAAQVKEAMVLDIPDSLQVVSLEEGHVAETDRVVALVSPENWKGKKGKHLRRVLAEAHDAAIILINPTEADKFLRPADYNAFESVYHLRPMRVNYLQPLPPSQHHPPAETDGDLLEYERERVEAWRGGVGGGFGEQQEPTGEALLLERLSESVWAEEIAFGAAAAAAAATAFPDDSVDGAASPIAAASTNGGSDMPPEDMMLFDGASGDGAAAAAAVEIEESAAQRALARVGLEMDTAATSSEMGCAEGEGEKASDKAAAAAMAAWSDEGEEEEADEVSMGRKEPRWGEAEVGEWDRGGDEAMEMSALAVTLRQYPDAWEAFVDLHDGMGFRLCGTWDMEPPQHAVRTVVMDHILRIVMD